MILSKIQELDLDLIGFPRLVRLNPQVPWKTRGNGAVSFQLGKGVGNPTRVGHVNTVDILSFPSSDDAEIEKECIGRVKDLLVHDIEFFARLPESNTNPGVVIVSHQFEEAVYWDAVRKIVEKDEMITLIEKEHGWFKEFKNGRGIIGATAGIGWRGFHDKTFELIAYRIESRWGSRRTVDDASVRYFDKKCVSAFDNYDYDNNHINIMPNSPCPVLFGIRGDSYQDLIEYMPILKTEWFGDWLIFESNQGTDDHIIDSSLGEIQEFESVNVKGVVSKEPVTISGGHVIFSINDGKYSIECAAYEPTKQFRDVIRQLEIGDEVRVYGGVRKKPFTINLEKIGVLHCVDVFEKVENPVCPVCKKHMKSKGKGQGFYCKKCRTRADEGVMKKKNRSLKEGLYEVPVCARRHLSRPLKRTGKVSNEN